MSKLVRKWKHRKPGIYLVRTDRHLRPGRENGYVGRSVNWEIRRKQHLGQDARHAPKPWTDLRPRWIVLRMPWWLGWKWVLAPLELLAILVLLPRYNDALNHGNPRRVTLSRAAAQRLARDVGDPWLARKRLAVTWGMYALRGVGVACVLAGFAGYLLTR